MSSKIDNDDTIFFTTMFYRLNKIIYLKTLKKFTDTQEFDIFVIVLICFHIHYCDYWINISSAFKCSLYRYVRYIGIWDKNHIISLKNDYYFWHIRITQYRVVEWMD